MSIKKAVCFIAAMLMLASVLSSCAGTAKKTALRAIIIPKFEVGEIKGDFPGEAQLFYERYCDGCEETEIPNMPPTARFLLTKRTVWVY